MLEKPLKCPNCGTHFFVDEVLNVQEHPKEAMPVECPNCHQKKDHQRLFHDF